ncbi:MAG TPA: efflux RND transporter periplasmic adaptor subunit [Bryobacteraceae bacterium]|nr:efflux RND transporter periplasmic adaptor subunit [Bryobacteraceae bacterium]
MQTNRSVIDELESSSNLPVKSNRTRLLVSAVLLLLILLAIGIGPRLVRSSEANDIARAAADPVPVVSTVQASPAPPTSQLDLPGNVEAVYVSSIYARSSGYLKRRLVDIGSRVKAGQLLAEIESPEIDQQLAQSVATLAQTKAAYEQARANLVQAQASVNQAHANVDQAVANRQIAATTDHRWTRLVSRGVLSKQDGDEKRSSFEARQAEVAASSAGLATAEATVTAQRANLDAAKANINAAEADVNRLRQMVSFERVTAPFEGVITERRVERGDLITAGSGSPQSNLFSIAQSGILRIQVRVPQAYAVDIHNGQTAEIEVRERAGHPVTGKVVRSADALNADSRTLLTEVQVDNRSGELLPGMYADVKFTLSTGRNVVLIPADTLVVNGQGTRVAIVTTDSKLHFVNLELGRDLGPQVEVLHGLTGNEQLVANPSDALTESELVHSQPRKS